MSDNLSLDIIFHNEVQKLLDNFASVMRSHVVFFGPHGEVLRQGRGEGNCRFCQMIQSRFTLKPCVSLDQQKQLKAFQTGSCQSYICHAGLWEAIMPVMAGGDLFGYVVIGQIRSTKKIPENLKNIFPVKKQQYELEKAFRALPYLSPDEMDNLTGLMRLLVDYIVRSEFVTRSGDHLYRAISGYIEKNLAGTIKITDAARHVGRSVSAITHFLQKNHNTNFKRLLIEKRLQNAENLLRKNPGLTIKEAADLSGFTDPYYFSRIYNKYRGIPPGTFLKKIRNAGT